MRLAPALSLLSVCLLGGVSAGAQQSADAAAAQAIADPTVLSADSSYTGPWLGLGAGSDMLLGTFNVPPTPAGMLARSAPGDPAMVYFALYHRTGAGISAADAAIIDRREADLARAAAFRGYNLNQSGWMYQQAICPATQPEASAMAADGDAQGSILLHFARSEGSRLSVFTAIVPRNPSLPVRTIGVAHNSMEQHQKFLSVDTTGAVVNAAIPPPVLYAALEPMSGWIAAGACIAEMGGAYPHIPNEPSLSNDLLRAPSPYLRLGKSREREVLFTDRIDEHHYVVWDENVSANGKMQSAHREQVTIGPTPYIHPKAPKTVRLAEGAQPPVVVRPYPPSPIPGAEQ